MPKDREHLLQRRQELIQRMEAIRADLARGLDRDPEEQAVELENLEVLEELHRMAKEELERVEADLARRQE